MDPAVLEGALAAFRRDGIGTVEGVFDSAECAEMRALLDAAIEDATAGPGRDWRGFAPAEQVVRAGETVFALWDTYERAQGLIPFSEHPAIVAFCRRALGGAVLRATSGTMFDKVAGGPAAIGAHQDAFFQLVPPAGAPPVAAWAGSPHADEHLGVLHVHPPLIEPFTPDLFLRCLTVCAAAAWFTFWSSGASHAACRSAAALFSLPALRALNLKFTGLTHNLGQLLRLL
jgi:hypothetical protein